MTPDLPFAHTVVPTYYRHPSGSWIPCDGPHGLALNEDSELMCSTCRTKVVRIAEASQ